MNWKKFVLEMGSPPTKFQLVEPVHKTSVIESEFHWLFGRKATVSNNEKNKIMIEMKSQKPLSSKMLTFVFIALHISSCNGQVNENENGGKEENTTKNQNEIHALFGDFMQEI